MFYCAFYLPSRERAVPAVIDSVLFCWSGLPNSVRKLTECRREGREDFEVDGPQDWSSHVEKTHGLIHAPNLAAPAARQQSSPPKVRSAQCLICEASLFSGGSFSKHTNKAHSHVFQQPFPCPECRRGGLEKVIQNHSAWLEHTSSVHGHDGCSGEPITREVKGTRKRKRNADALVHDVERPKLKGCT